MSGTEVNFDGLVGPTHHYAGLSFGNEASTRYRNTVANPRLAAKQGLKKMKALADAGYPQAVIPPQERPNVPLLRQLGHRPGRRGRPDCRSALPALSRNRQPALKLSQEQPISCFALLFCPKYDRNPAHA